MRAVLIHVRDPQFYTVPRNPRAKNGRIRVMAFPPLGIMSLSAALQHAGHECFLFDQCNPETPNDTIIREIRRLQPDLVGLSFLSSTSYPYAKTLAREIRAANEKVKVALGGVFASLNARDVSLQCPEVDFVCRGEGEDLLVDLLEHLDAPEAVDGLTWSPDGRTVRDNRDRPLEQNLDKWPFPDRDGIGIDYIESMPLDVPAVLSFDRSTTVQTSRGCPFSCAFCDIPAFSKRRWRARSAANVLAELKDLQDRGYRSASFIDDHFLMKPRRVEQICSGIIDSDIRIRWSAEGRVDTACIEMFPLLVRAGCSMLMFGIESGSQKILDRLGKRQDLKTIEVATRAAKKAGIKMVHGFFVVGSPDETEEDMCASFRLAERLPLDTFAFNRLCVYRGTPLWKEYAERGLVNDSEDWYKYFKCSSVDPTVLSGEEIHRIRSREMRRLLLHKLTHFPLQSMRTLARFLRHMSFRDVTYLLIKPFVGEKSGATQAEVFSRTIEEG